MNTSRVPLGQSLSDITFECSASVNLAPAAYVEITVDLGRVLSSWRASLFAHEWLDKSGHVKTDAALNETRLLRRKAVRAALKKKGVLERPVLGIGMFDNVEIGTGADVLSTLYFEGVQTLCVHVRKGQQADFMTFMA